MVVSNPLATINQQVERWVRDVVVDLNLCPFARRELEAGAIHLRQVDARNSTVLLDVLADEMHKLLTDSSIETTLVICTKGLEEFLLFNDALGQCEALLQKLGLEGVLQVASFHPHYEFADAPPDDPANYSNRSPYPIFHLLREDSVTRAVAAHPGTAGIPENNIALLRSMGNEALAARLHACFNVRACDE